MPHLLLAYIHILQLRTSLDLFVLQCLVVYSLCDNDVRAGQLVVYTLLSPASDEAGET